MKKHELKDYNRLLKMENEDLWELLLMAENTLGDDCRCGEIKLLQEENNELVKDLNDLQADWAESNVVAGTAMLTMATEISRVTEERDRFRGIIRELKKEKYDMGMELEKLKKQNEKLKKQNGNLIAGIETAQKRLNGMAEAQR